MNILILGDGLLGHEIHHQTAWNFVSRKKNGFDICNIKHQSHLLAPYDTIVNCIAHTDTYTLDREICQRINFQAVAELNDVCMALGKKLIHISTDYVYANCHKAAKEEDVPMPQQTHYAQTKLLADNDILARGKDFLIVRCSHKPKPFPYPGAWTDVKGNFDYVDVIASLIIKLIRHDATGIFNVGTTTKTMFELARQTKPEVSPTLKSNPLTPSSVEMNLDKLHHFLRSFPGN